MAPKLAAFSWCRLSGEEEKNSIAILGGTDGNILQNELYVIDMERQTASNRPAILDFGTAMGHMFFQEDSTTLHHIGGISSMGVNFFLKLKDDEWEESMRSHSAVANAHAMELVNNTSLYFT